MSSVSQLYPACTAEDIIKVIFDQAGKPITRMENWNIRERIKTESYHWYKTMREGEYE